MTKYRFLSNLTGTSKAMSCSESKVLVLRSKGLHKTKRPTMCALLDSRVHTHPSVSVP